MAGQTTAVEFGKAGEYRYLSLTGAEAAKEMGGGEQPSWNVAEAFFFFIAKAYTQGKLFNQRPNLYEGRAISQLHPPSAFFLLQKWSEKKVSSVLEGHIPSILVH